MELRPATRTERFWEDVSLTGAIVYSAVFWCAIGMIVYRTWF